VQGVRSSE